MLCSVTDKLKELEYTEEDWDFDSLRIEGLSKYKEYTTQWKILTRQKKELTLRSKCLDSHTCFGLTILYNPAWKTLAPKLIELIKAPKSDLEQRQNKYRYSQRQNEFVRLYDSHVLQSNLTYGEIHLVPIDSYLLNTQTVRDFLEYDDSRREITSELFSEFLPTIQRLCSEHKLQALSEHEAAVVKWRKKASREIPDLGDSKHIYLASSLFPVFLANWNEFYYFNSTYPTVVAEPAFCLDNSSYIRNWQAIRVRMLDAFFFELSDALLTGLGFPLNTTMKTMLELGDCFVCRRCESTLVSVVCWIELVRTIQYHLL